MWFAGVATPVVIVLVTKLFTCYSYACLLQLFLLIILSCCIFF